MTGTADDPLSRATETQVCLTPLSEKIGWKARLTELIVIQFARNGLVGIVLLLALMSLGYVVYWGATTAYDGIKNEGVAAREMFKDELAKERSLFKEDIERQDRRLESILTHHREISASYRSAMEETAKATNELIFECRNQTRILENLADRHPRPPPD